MSLARSLTPLFAGKPLLVVGTKVDIAPFDSLDAEEKGLVRGATRRGASLARASRTISSAG